MREAVTTVLDVTGLVVLAVGGGVAFAGFLRDSVEWMGNGSGAMATGVLLLVGSGVWAWWGARA